MKWKDYIENQYIQGRIPQEWKVKIITTAETAIEDYKLELLDNLEILYQNSNKNKDSIEERNKSAYYTRLETIQEILNLINK